jgi:hypothetical protein
MKSTPCETGSPHWCHTILSISRLSSTLTCGTITSYAQLIDITIVIDVATGVGAGVGGIVC